MSHRPPTIAEMRQESFDEWVRRAEQAEARMKELEDEIRDDKRKMLDLVAERQKAEAALERAVADGVAMRDNYEGTVKAALAILPGQREPRPDDSLQQLVNLARGLMEENLEMDLSEDHPGDKLPETIYRHRKGGMYRIIARGFLERDLTPVVIYQSLDNDKYWVRPAMEFDDGRFEALAALDETGGG